MSKRNDLIQLRVSTKAKDNLRTAVKRKGFSDTTKGIAYAVNKEFDVNILDKI
jgi:hypothetical protein